jgi:hypothetical protein
VRFVSAEPLLGPLIPRLEQHMRDGRSETWYRWPDGYGPPGLRLYGIDWLIAGGESGPKARPCREDWLRDLRDACAATGTAFFLKQLGATPRPRARPEGQGRRRPGDARRRAPPRDACRAWTLRTSKHLCGWCDCELVDDPEAGS